MKKLLLLLVFVIAFQVKAQEAIQEFNFNGKLSNIQNSISFSGIIEYVSDRTGEANSAVRITNTAIEATIQNLPLSNQARTVSIWVKYNDITTANYIWGYGSSHNAQYFGLLQQSTTTSKSDLNLAGWGSTNDVIVTTMITPDTWYNYTVTYDGLSSKIYRNGELIKSSISPRKLTSGLVFGIGKMGTAVSINADIDDLKIYDVALSGAEVAAIYNDSSVLAPNDLLDSLYDGKVATTKKKMIKSTTVTTNPNTVLKTHPTIIAAKTSEIYSADGQKVFTSNKNDIDITALPEGTYILKVSSPLKNSNDVKLTAN